MWAGSPTFGELGQGKVRPTRMSGISLLIRRCESLDMAKDLLIGRTCNTACFELCFACPVSLTGAAPVTKMGDKTAPLYGNAC